MLEKVCEICASSYFSERSASKYCSKKCYGKSIKAKPNTVCTNCGIDFHMKESQKVKGSRTLGLFCSVKCSAESKTKSYLGSKNPNNKNRNVDSDGYRIYSPQNSLLLGSKKMKLHKALALEVLGIEDIPKGFHIHHRDCDVLNNETNNLAVLSISDHRWLHKQFGNATLWAYIHGKVLFEDLVSWSDDKDRAYRLLNISLENQCKGDIINV